MVFHDIEALSMVTFAVAQLPLSAQVSVSEIKQALEMVICPSLEDVLSVATFELDDCSDIQSICQSTLRDVRPLHRKWYRSLF